MNGVYSVYADDTCLLHSGKTANILENAINTDLELLQHWLDENRLVINIQKTNFLVFKTINKPDISLKLKINGKDIQRESKVKYLGMVLDDGWDWGPHYQHFSSKIAKLIGALKSCPNVNQNVAKLIYNSFILSHVRYNITVWSQCGKKYIEKTEILLKKCLKILYKLPFRTPTNELFQVTDTQPLERLIFMENAKLMYKIKNNLLKHNLDIKTNGDYHNYNTRNRNDIRQPYARTTIMSKSMYNNSAKAFNNLPKYIKDSKSIKTFTKMIKNYLKNL